MKTPRDIVYVQQGHMFGACENYLLKLMKGIDSTKFNISLIYPAYFTLEPFVQEAVNYEVKVYEYSPDVSGIRAFYQFLTLFKKIQPDIIHFNDPCIRAILASTPFTKPVKIMTHHTPELNRAYSWKGDILEKVAFHGLDYVIFTSEYDRRTGITKDGLLKRNSFVIPLGINMRRFTENFNPKNVRVELGITEKTGIVGTVARLAKQKGHIYLIKAAEVIAESFDPNEIKFVLVGDGELKEELEAEIENRGLKNFFIFTGYVENVPQYLNIFDVFVMPSVFEGQCLAVTEALAMGKPVIATSVGGIQSAIEEGKNGLLVPPKDPSALADAIVWMFDNYEKAKEMGQIGRKKAMQEYTEEKMVQRTQNLYEKILES